MEGYAKCLEGKRAEWDEGTNVEQMWEQVKQAMVDSAREVCFRIENAVRQGTIMSPWFCNVKEVKVEMGRRGESSDCLVSYMQLTWFCVESQRKT